MANYNIVEENVRGINNLNIVEYTIGDKTYRNLVYIPENYNQDTPVFMYGHGYNPYPTPNNVPEFGPIYDYISNNNPNSIVVMSLDRYTEYYGAVEAGYHMNDFLGVLKDNFNIKGNNVMFAGFSSGGPAPLAAAMAMRAQDPNSQPVVVTLDSICYRWLFYEKNENGRPINGEDSEEALNMLNGITIVDLYHSYNSHSDLEKLSAHGANVVRAYINNGHSVVNATFFNKCILDFQSGNGNLDFLNEITFKRFSAEANDWVEITDRDEIERIFLGMAENFPQTDDSLMYEDNYINQTINENKKMLRNLSTIKCDNEFIESSANNVINKIKSMNYLKTKTRGYYSSTTSIPNIIIDKMYEIELALENKLEMLAQSFYSLAEASGEFEKLNDNLSNEAGTLGTIGTVGTTGGWYPSTSGGTLSGGITSGGVTASPTIPSPQTPEEDKKPQPDTEKEPEENIPNENENKEPEENTPNENKPQEDENKEPEENTPSEDENKQEEKPEQNTSSSNSNNKKPSSNKTPSKKPSSSNKNDKNDVENPPITEIPDTSNEPNIQIEPEEPVIPEEPIIPQPDEPVIPDEPIIPEEPTQDIEDTSSPFKTIGILAGAGAAVGTGAYAAHKIIEKKKNEEDKENIYSDYAYDDEDEIIEEESNNDQITPFDDNE